MPAPKRDRRGVAESPSRWNQAAPTTFLLDVNVLIALIDPMHSHHEMAHAWFARAGKLAWATCPLVENGVIRIVGGKSYPKGPGSCGVVAAMLKRFCAHPGHRFWPDDVSLVVDDGIDRDRLLQSAQVTDTCLLALAVKHGGKLASFDRRLVTDAVRGGRDALHLIE